MTSTPSNLKDYLSHSLTTVSTFDSRYIVPNDEHNTTTLTLKLQLRFSISAYVLCYRPERQN